MKQFFIKTLISTSLLGLLLGLQSCISWTDAQGNRVQLISIEISGVNHDYGDLSQKDKELIVFLDSTDTEIPPSLPNKVFAINAAQMKASMQASQKYVLYMWKPECKSKNCVPISAVKRLAMQIQARSSMWFWMTPSTPIT